MSNKWRLFLSSLDDAGTGARPLKKEPLDHRLSRRGYSKSNRRRTKRFTPLISEWLEPRNLLAGTASIAGLVWDDVDGDGTRGAGEPGKSGVTVYLDVNDNNALDAGEPTKITAADGSYSFPDLDAGSYVVREQVQANRRLTSPQASGQRLFAVNNLSSPVKIQELNHQTGAVIRSFSAPAGTFSYTNGLAFDGQTLYFLSNNNRTLYTLNPNTGAVLGSTVIPGSSFDASLAVRQGKVYLLDSSGDGLLSIFDPATNTVTGSLTFQYGVGNGLYDSLGDLAATNEFVVASYYRVNFLDATTGIQLRSFETGIVGAKGVQGVGDEIFISAAFNPIRVYSRSGALLRTLPNSNSSLGDLAGYADLSGSNRVTLAAGQAESNVDFGDGPVFGSIRGTRWQDANSNRVRDGGEVPLAGKTVYLDTNDNGSLDVGETTTLTQSDGSYAFNNLAAGNYVIREVVTSGFSQTYPLNSKTRLFTSSYVPSSKIYEVDPDTGAILNSFNSPFSGYADLAFDGVALYTINDVTKTIYKINPDTGATIASAPLPSGIIYDGLAAVKGLLYSYPIDNSFTVIDPTTLSVVGTIDTNGYSDTLWSVSQMTNPDRIMGLNTTSEVASFDPATGALSIGFSVRDTTPVIYASASGPKLYVSDNNGHINVHSMATGALLQTLNFAPDVRAIVYLVGTLGAQRITLMPGQIATGVDFGVAEPSPINQPPALGVIADPVTVARDGSATVNLTGISAGPFETQTVTITATSSNPALIPDPVVSYTSPQSTGSLLLTPSAGQVGTAVITVTLKDNGGTANGGNDTLVRTFNVIVNSAPVLDATKTPTLPTLEEDPGAPSGAVGSLVANLVDFATPSGELDNVTDVDSGAVLGIAVTGTGSNVVCYYSLNGGTTWTNFSPISTSNSRLIAADADNRIYCQPKLNVNGTIASAMTFRAWDQTTGTDGGTADTTVSGGGTAFSSATDGVSLAVTPVNDAPQATNLNSGETYTEDTARNLTNIVVSDVDSTMVTATLTLSNPSAGILSTSTSGAVTSTYTAATGVWTASGPIANVNTVLAAATFTPVANFNANFTIATRVSDDLNAAVSGSKAMTGIAVNDVPMGTNLSVAESYSEDTPLNLTDIVVSDVDNLPLTVKLTLSNINAGSLSVATSGAVTSTYVAATGVWTASGAIADVNTLLAGVTFNPKLDFNGNFTIATSVSDGVAAAVTGSKTITGIAVNDAPTATNINAAETYTEDTAKNLTDIVANDVDNTTVTATLTLSNSAAGSLNTGTSGSVTSTYNANTGVWTAGGAIANVNTLLAGLTFTPTVNFNGNFTISTNVSDGTTEIAGAKAFSGVAVNDAPVLDTTKTPTLADIPEDASFPFGTVGTLVSDLVDFATISGGLDNVSDVDEGALLGVAVTAQDINLDCYYSLSGGNPWIPFLVSTPAARLVAGDSDNRIYCRAIASNLNGTFAALTFRAWDQTAGSDGFTLNLGPTGGTTPFSAATGTIRLTITPVNDAPTATNMSAAESYTEDTPLDLIDIVASDVDTSALTATLVLSNASAGSLSTATSGAVTSTYDSAMGVWTASGAVADVNTLLAGVVFNPMENFNGNFSINTSITDGELTVSGVKIIGGSAVNDAPTATNLNAVENYTEDTAYDLADIVVSDVDGTVVTATLTLSNLAAGSLSTATSGTTTSTFNSGAGVWTASGPITEVNALLAGVRYHPAINFNANFSILASVSDSDAATVTGSKTVTGTPVNDAPTATNLSTEESYTEDVSLNLLDIVISDVDSAEVTATLTVSNPNAGSLSTGVSGGVNSTYNPATGVWTASGATANVNALLAGVSFIPTLNFNGSFSIATSVSDGVAAAITDSKPVTGNAVNDAPVLNNIKSPVLPTVQEDPGPPSGAMGALVSSFVNLTTPVGGLDNVTDADSSALLGIAIVDVNPSFTCYVSLNGGTSWGTVGAVTTAGARLLAADVDNRVYCQPGLNLNGNFTTAFTFRAWDQTSGTDGATADTTTNGNATPFSTTTDGVGILIQAVNDSPVANGTTATLPSIAEDSLDPPSHPVANLFGSLFSDVDGSTIAFGGVAIIAQDATSDQGKWQFQNGNGAFNDFPDLIDSAAVIVLAASDRLRFVPAPDFNGMPGGLTVRLWDGTGGFHSSDLVQEISTSIGGSGAFSDNANEVTLSTTILPVNDPPNLAPFSGNSTAADEDPQTRGPALQKTEFNWAQNFDAGASFETSQKLTFQVTNNNNGLFAVQPAINSQGTLTYTPKPNMHGTASVTVVLKDDAGGNDTSVSQQFDIVITKTHPLHNSAEAGQRNGLDVTGSTSILPDGFIVSADVLAVINYINAKGSGRISATSTPGPPYCDVNGDDNVAADDALKIINYINANPGQPEAEATTMSQVAASQPAADNLLSELISLLSHDIAEQAARRRRLQ
jgi:hypothetical protein